MGEHANRGRKAREAEESQAEDGEGGDRPSLQGSEVRIQAQSENSISGSANRVSRQREMEGDDGKLTIH